MTSDKSDKYKGDSKEDIDRLIERNTLKALGIESFNDEKDIDIAEDFFVEETSLPTEKQDRVKSLGASKKTKPKPKLKPKPKPWTKRDDRLLALLYVIGIIAFPFTLIIFRALVSGLIIAPILYPALIALYIPIISFGLLYSFSKKFRDKTKNVFINLFKLPQKLYKESQSLVPKNILTRLVLNIGFVVVWFFVIDSLSTDIMENNWELYQSPLFPPFILTLFFAPIFFITFIFWFKDIKDIPNTFSKTKKETRRRIKSTAKYLSKSNISDADELKKYAELKDKGIITEEEFQAKKKQLLDL